jgi:hypothetical protein
MRVQSTIDNLQSVKQAVDIILNTNRFRWQIYSANVGTELEELIGEDSAYIESELPRMVEDALSADDRVTEVGDFDFTFNNDSVTVTFTVQTVFGAFSEELTV